MDQEFTPERFAREKPSLLERAVESEHAAKNERKLCRRRTSLQNF
jgi:hypothetical protein